MAQPTDLEFPPSRQKKPWTMVSLMPLTVIGLACTWQLAVVPPPCDPGAPCVAGTFLGIPLGLYGAAYFLAQLMLLTTAIYQGAASR